MPMNTAPDRPEVTSAAIRQRWDNRYAEGCTPWDTQITPPEVVAFWDARRLATAGIALDLGCGPGTNVRYLARLGLDALGAEIAAAPLLTAQARSLAEPVAVRQRISFLCADVSRLPFHRLDAAYILDVGCLHSLPTPVRRAYAQGVLDNLKPGGYYHVYAFDAWPASLESPPSGPDGMAPGEVAALFTPQLELVEIVEGIPERRPCRWYLLRKPD
jgi:SAM-dependent methyltransferase